MATKKAAKSAKKAPQPVKKTPAKKAVVKPAPKAAKKAEPVKASHKKVTAAVAAVKSNNAKSTVAKAKAPASASKTAKPAAAVQSKAPVKGKEATKPIPIMVKSGTPSPKKSTPAPAHNVKPGHGKTGNVAVGKTASTVAAKAATAKTTVPAKPAPVTGKPAAAPAKPVTAPAKTAPVPQKPAIVAAKPAPPVKAAEVKVEPKSTVIARPTPKPETKLVDLKPIKTSVATTVKYEPDFTKSVLDDPGHTILNAPTMRYSDAELAEFKDLIMRKLEAAKKELTYLQGLITRKDEMGGDESENRYMTMEDGSISMEREQLSQMASRQIQFIDHLEKALMRIENKTYGICRVSGKLIDKARLRAVPHATLSIEAKMGLVKKPENQNVQ